MRRRQFLIVLGSATFACGRSAQSQQTKVYRIGLLDYSPPEAGRVRLWDAFRQQLRALGYVEGRNTTFETRWADGKADRLPALAAELVNLNVDLIVTGGTSTAVAAARATTMILAGMPVLVIVMLVLTSPHYLEPLYRDIRGFLLDGLALAMLGTGVGIMTKMARFEI